MGIVEWLMSRVWIGAYDDTEPQGAGSFDSVAEKIGIAQTLQRFFTYTCPGYRGIKQTNNGSSLGSAEM